LDNYKKEYIEFIETAIHDLDSPLRKLSFFSERLSHKLKNTAHDDVQDYLSRMQSCVTDMRDVIEGLALLSRFTAEEVQFSPCSPEAIATAAWEELNDEQKKNATIRIAPLPQLTGDAAKLTQLFENLFENSIKFSNAALPPVIDIREGAIDEEDRMRLNLDDKPYHKIEIEDNGIGFERACAETIFKPFVRLHGKSQFPGSGLGLSICKKIIDNHHGDIYADSNGNSGALFVLLLPKKD
jgi:signal transduction histidine kinase